MRREIPAIILFVTGLIIILERFFNLPVLSSWGQGIRTWGVIVGSSPFLSVKTPPATYVTLV